MILLVIGLVAVIVVVLIAVFLSIRLGRSDEDDEPDLRSGGRDRRRDQDERWRERDTRRVPSSARTSGRDGASRGPDGYGSRGPARERDSRGRDYDGASRRPARPGAPGYRKPASARSAVGAPAPARGRYDTGPSRPPADDYPSADHPSMDFGPGGSYPAGDHPSVDFPAADYGAMDDPKDRRSARRKANSAPAAAKNRARQRGKRDDDDDWPSTEWDKLSDEQYWAELSADKPLASMARPSKSAKEPAAPANGKAKARPAARDPRPARPPVPERDLPSHKERAGQREAAAERLPVRAGARQVPPAPVAPRRQQDTAAAGRSYPDPHGVLDTGPQPRGDRRRRDTTGPHAARDQDQPVRGGLAGSPSIPGALEDDPLTSPSFSLKAVRDSDSRSYSNARRHAKPTGQPSADGAAHGNRNGRGGYPAADYASPGYADQAVPMPAARPPAPGEWYSAPPVQAAEAHTPAYGNPYQRPDGNGGSPATAGYPRYLADPLHVYAPPGYREPAPYPEPAPPAAVPYADGYPGHPYSDQTGYQRGHGANGHAPRYQEGYQADPYAGGGYGTYPPQG